MRELKRFVLAMLLLMVSLGAKAYDFYVDGICYNKLSDGSCEVTFYNYLNGIYSGNVVIPPTVTYKNTTYQVTTISSCAFLNCTRLTSITIPNGVTSIGESAFQSCEGLTSITIPESVTSIGRQAFHHCTGLTSINIPNSVTSIGDYAFYGCTALPVIDNIRYADTYALEAIASPSVMKLKEGTRGIMPEAFKGCSSLTSITIPESVTSIGHSAFEGCYNLTSITIPNGVTSIQYSTFKNCSKLKEVTFPKSVTDIAYDAFEGCRDLCYAYTKNVSQTRATLKVTPGTINGGEIRMNGKAVTSGDITFEGLCPNTKQSISLCLWVNGISRTLRTIEFTTKDVNISIRQEHDVSTATLKPTITADDGLTIKKVYWTNYEGEELHLTGLLPDTKYTFTLNVETEYGGNKNYNTTKTVELTTQKLAIATLPAQAMNTKTALLCAETNLSEEEENVGFEWRRYDAPTTMPSSKVTCAVTDGKMMGALSNLNPDVYYNYRPYYTTSNGQSYYGEWITFFTGDAAVFFDPTVKTYSASTVSQTSAVLKGYALRGSEDIARQGFQLWNEWGKAREERSMARAAASGVREIVVSGQKMTCTLTDLEPGTTYKYRTFVETTDGKTTYGDEMEFTTEAPTAIGDAIEEAQEVTVTGYYNLQGHRLNGLQKGINVIRYSDGSARKMMVK